MRSARPEELVRGAWGLVLLARPDAVIRRVGGHPSDDRSRAVARVLGARHVAQALLGGLHPTRTVLALGVVVDLLHAGTAVGLAVVDGDRARLGWTDAAVATTFAALGVATFGAAD